MKSANCQFSIPTEAGGETKLDTPLSPESGTSLYDNLQRAGQTARSLSRRPILLIGISIAAIEAAIQPFSRIIEEKIGEKRKFFSTFWISLAINDKEFG